MRNFQGIFETLKRSFISIFLICITVPLKGFYLKPIEPATFLDGESPTVCVTFKWTLGTKR